MHHILMVMITKSRVRLTW